MVAGDAVDFWVVAQYLAPHLLFPMPTSLNPMDHSNPEPIWVVEKEEAGVLTELRWGLRQTSVGKENTRSNALV